MVLHDTLSCEPGGKNQGTVRHDCKFLGRSRFDTQRLVNRLFDTSSTANVRIGAIKVLLTPVFSWSTNMAETVHLYLKANQKEILGESTQHSNDRENSIECLSFSHEIKTAREATSGLASGRRQYEPLRITKRIDASSPLLLKAMVENQRIDGEFRFFRPNPIGDGNTQPFYTITIADGRIAGMKQMSEDTLNPAQSVRPPLEEVTFVLETISWTYLPTGATHEDSWSNNR
jgi:type VI secretion system secreted protein Hcp